MSICLIGCIKGQSLGPHFCFFDCPFGGKEQATNFISSFSLNSYNISKILKFCNQRLHFFAVLAFEKQFLNARMSLTNMFLAFEDLRSNAKCFYQTRGRIVMIACLNGIDAAHNFGQLLIINSIDDYITSSWIVEVTSLRMGVLDRKDDVKLLSKSQNRFLRLFLTFKLPVE
ncbi:hypothetical protein EDC96DRAFT_548201 [Choanephora cucurbitarum]|nr:hypothetical protein EDC96DRAFT_548201 [Choanephora cucurbitarum]